MNPEMPLSPFISYSIEKDSINYTKKELRNAPLSSMLIRLFVSHEDYFAFFKIESGSYIKHNIRVVFESCKMSKAIYLYMPCNRAIYVHIILSYLIMNSGEQRLFLFTDLFLTVSSIIQL